MKRKINTDSAHHIDAQNLGIHMGSANSLQVETSYSSFALKDPIVATHCHYRRSFHRPPSFSAFFSSSCRCLLLTRIIRRHGQLIHFPSNSEPALRVTTDASATFRHTPPAISTLRTRQSIYPQSYLYFIKTICACYIPFSSAPERPPCLLPLPSAPLLT